MDTQVVSGTIPGNGNGYSCGTLGAISYLEDNIIAVTYQRKACKISSTNFNDKNEVGITFFTANLTKISEVPLMNGYNRNVIKSVKYGANIFIAIGASSSLTTFYPKREINSISDVMRVMLVSPTGEILTQSTIVTPYSLSPADDFEVLSDGSVAWTFVNSSGNLVYYRIPINPSGAFFVQKKFKLKHQLLAKKADVSDCHSGDANLQKIFDLNKQLSENITAAVADPFYQSEPTKIPDPSNPIDRPVITDPKDQGIPHRF